MQILQCLYAIAQCARRATAGYHLSVRHLPAAVRAFAQTQRRTEVARGQGIGARFHDLVLMTVAALMREWGTGEIRGLSLRQPYASLVAIGEKRIETRSFARKYHGPIAIASSAAWKRAARLRATEDPTFFAAWKRHRDLIDDVGQLPLGAIIAVARIVEYIPTEAIIAADNGRPPRRHLTLGGFRCGVSEIEFGDYQPNRFGWLLADVHRLALPVPCKGALGLWKIEPRTLRSLRRATAVPVV